MAQLIQSGFIFGANFTGETAAEEILYISVDETAIGDYINNQLHIRIQVTNDDTATGSNPWQLYYNTVNNPATAIQVTTLSSVVKIVDDTLIDDGDALIIDDEIGTPGGTWQDGRYSESDNSVNLDLADGFYTDFQFCIQFDNTAVLGQSYYFFLRFNNVVLDIYPSIENLPTVILATEKVRYVNTDAAAGGNGTTPASTGTNRAYASLNEWEAAEQDDLRPFYIPNIVYCSGSAFDDTAVTIDGWIVSASDTLSIVGDENPSGAGGRHAGIEGTGYALQPGSATNGILIKENYVTVDGIEINDIPSNLTILIKLETGADNTTIKNCILHAQRDDATQLAIHMNHPSPAIVYIYNNIIYDIGLGNAVYAGIRINSTPTVYAYNNTFANINGQGIRNVTGTVIAKNNLAVNCEFGCYSGTFGAGSNHNASDDATSTDGAQDRTNQTFSFVNDRTGFGGLESNPSTEVADYHLVWYDTGALGWGISLADDPNLAFTTDIDGDVRGDNNPSIGIWDIGADEFSGFYRGSSSSSQSSSSSSQSSSSSSTSSSSSSQSSSSSADNPYKIVRYINTDSTAGGTGTTNATTGDDRAYSSMVLWEAGEERDLVLENEHHVVYCSGSIPDATSVTIADWITSSTRNILIIGLGRADFSGKMTDIRIYNKGLTQAEAIALYKTSAQMDNRGDLWC